MSTSIIGNFGEAGPEAGGVSRRTEKMLTCTVFVS